MTRDPSTGYTTPDEPYRTPLGDEGCLYPGECLKHGDHTTDQCVYAPSNKTNLIIAGFFIGLALLVAGAWWICTHTP